MKHLLLALFLAHSSIAASKTFEQISSSFPLGTTKEEILKAEPSARVVPWMAPQLDSLESKENIILMETSNGSRLVCQFYLISDRLAAVMMARAFMPGTAQDKHELDFISSKKKLSEFSALRAGQKLEPLEIKVERFSMGKPHQVALSTSQVGPELWIVDESLIDSKSFFMPPTQENRDKLLKSKEMIDQKLKEKTEQGAAANP